MSKIIEEIQKEQTKEIKEQKVSFEMMIEAYKEKYGLKKTDRKLIKKQVELLIKDNLLVIKKIAKEVLIDKILTISGKSKKWQI